MPFDFGRKLVPDVFKKDVIVVVIIISPVAWREGSGQGETDCNNNVLCRIGVARPIVVTGGKHVRRFLRLLRNAFQTKNAENEPTDNDDCGGRIVSLVVHTNLPSSRLTDPPAGVFGDGDGWHVGASMCFFVVESRARNPSSIG